MFLPVYIGVRSFALYGRVISFPCLHKGLVFLLYTEGFDLSPCIHRGLGFSLYGGGRSIPINKVNGSKIS